MSTYSQWAGSFAKNGPARVTWVCGAERVLVHEVVHEVSAAIHPDYTESYTAGRDSEKDIWESALSSLSVMTRVVLVRDASRLRAWHHLRAWMRSRPHNIHLIFEAAEDDFPRDGDGKLEEHAAWLRDSSLGQLVRCSSLSPEDAVAWARRRLDGLGEDQARRLLDRASGSLAEVRTVLDKARLFRGRPTDEALALLCEELPGEFAERLILGDRKGALLAAESLGGELGSQIGLLASRLEVLSTLHRAARDNVSRRDVTGRLGVPANLAQKYAGVARDYPEERVARCWSALAVAEDAYRSGTAEGAAEVLVVSW